MSSVNKNFKRNDQQVCLVEKKIGYLNLPIDASSEHLKASPISALKLLYNICYRRWAFLIPKAIIHGMCIPNPHIMGLT